MSRSALAGAWASAAIAALVVAGTVMALAIAAALGHDAGHGSHGLFNDFDSYWGAGRALNEGRNPYDQGTLRAIYSSAGIHPEVGSGYSYPLFFAELMRPLALLPATAAGVVFSLLSLTALFAGVALLLSSLPDLARRGALVWGALIGISPPVAGSLYVGQVNLLLLPLLALAFRRVAPGAMLALAAAVKLFPVAGMAALAVRGRRGLRDLAAGVALLALLLVIPPLLASNAGYSGRVSELIAPDPYWTNVSINGLISRLAVPFDGIDPPLRGLPVEAVVVTVCALLGLAVLVLIARTRGNPWNLCLSLALAAGAVGAPKNSIWNYVPLVLCAVAAWPHVRERRRLRAWLWGSVLLIWMGSIGVFVTLLPGPPAVIRIWLGSLALVGALILGTVVAVLVAELGSRRD